MQIADCNAKDAFQCEKGVCIPQSWKCDGDYDCLNKADEKDCGKSQFAIPCFPGSTVESVCDHVVFRGLR